jgi:hypothetical protein
LAKRQREYLILYLKFLVPTVSSPSSQRTLNGYLKFCETETEQQPQGGRDPKVREHFKIHSPIHSTLLSFFSFLIKSHLVPRNIPTGGRYNVLRLSVFKWEDLPGAGIQHTRTSQGDKEQEGRKNSMVELKTMGY